MKDDGEVQLRCQSQLASQPAALAFPARRVVIIVQSDFADSHHPGMGTQRAQFLYRLGGGIPLFVAPVSRFLRVNPSRRPHIGIALGQGDTPPGGGKIAGGVDNATHALGRQEIQQGFDAALDERMKSERMKIALIANVSHDLKTPLTSILSYADLLCGEELPEPAGDYARILRSKALRLKDMVQDVFEVSKAASGQLPVTLERIDYGKLIRQTLADMAEAIEESPVLIREQLPDAPVLIRADGQRLYRVFQNLIQNALQYSLPGSRVYIRLEMEEGKAAASVKNTSQAELKPGTDYTERFVRGDESRTDGGSGLGLSIARSFTEACGGTLSIETDGDRFTAIVEFPLDGTAS